jgi:hypothetical protein
MHHNHQTHIPENSCRCRSAVPARPFRLAGRAAGAPDKQWDIAKEAVEAGTATFEVQQPDGPLYKFTLSIVKGRLQGDMVGERDGQTRRAKVDAAKAAPAKPK